MADIVEIFKSCFRLPLQKREEMDKERKEVIEKIADAIMEYLERKYTSEIYKQLIRNFLIEMLKASFEVMDTIIKQAREPEEQPQEQPQQTHI